MSKHLTDTVRSQASLIAAVAAYDQQAASRMTNGDSGYDPFDATLGQLREAYEDLDGLGKTGEFTLARQEGDQIVFLLSHRYHDFEDPLPVSMSSPNAEPVKRALDGESGTVVGLDYRGEQVLAAYEPIEELGIGIVAKIDLAEIRGAFIRTGLISTGIAVVLVFFGALLSYRIANPMVRELVVNEERLRHTFEAITEGVWDWNVTTGEIVFSRTWPELFGYSFDEIEHNIDTWSHLLHPDDKDAVMRRLTLHFEGKTDNYVSGHRMKHKDGRWIWVLDRGRVVERDAEGKPLRVVGADIDITERKRAAEQLKAGRDFLEKLTDSMCDTVFSVRMPERVIEWVNDSYGIIGYEPDECVGRDTSFLYANQEDFEDFGKRLKESMDAGNSVFTTERLMKRKDGEVFPADIAVTFHRVDGEVTKVTSIIRDITERRQSEEKLRESEERNRAIVSNAPIGVAIYDDSGQCLIANDAIVEMIGAPAAEVLKQNYNSLSSWRESGMLQVAKSALADQNHKRFELSVESSFGKPVHLDCHFAPLPSGELLLMGVDISERMHAEEEREELQAQLLQSEKLASVGQLAAGVAHEINNPMGFISSNLGIMKKYLARIKGHLETSGGPDSDEQTEIVEIVTDFGDAISESLEGSDRVKKIVADLKGFTRADSLKMEATDLNVALDSTLNIVWNQIKYTCQVEKDLGELPPVQCYRSQISQVILNLLVNAGQAIGDGPGTIRIKTWADDKDCYISVKDDGCGIAQEHLAKIFDPFFTTKEVGKGTGLSLSVSYEIIKKHGGRIDIDSVVGVGTEFVVSLPLEPSLTTKKAAETDILEGQA